MVGIIRLKDSYRLLKNPCNCNYNRYYKKARGTKLLKNSDISLLKANLKSKHKRKNAFIFEKKRQVINSNITSDITIDKNKVIALLLEKQLELEKLYKKKLLEPTTLKSLEYIEKKLLNIGIRLNYLIDNYEKKLSFKLVKLPAAEKTEKILKFNAHPKTQNDNDSTYIKILYTDTIGYFRDRYYFTCNNLINLYGALNPNKNTNVIYKRLYDYKNYRMAQRMKKFKPFFNFTRDKHFKNWIKLQNYNNGFKDNCMRYFEKYILPLQDYSFINQ